MRLLSFFPKWDRVLDKYDDECERRVAAAALCEAQNQVAPEVVDATETGGRSSAAYHSQRFPALFLDAHARHPNSLLRLPGFCDGVSNAVAYLKVGFQLINMHVEQWLLPFVHHQLI